MNRTIFAVILASLSFPTSALAVGQNTDPAMNKIILKPGNSYQVDNLNIMCIPDYPITPIVTRECQYYGGFSNERCLYEEKIYLFEDKKCIADCQHWNSRNNRCSYSTTCAFKPLQKIFIKTTCKKFDTFHNKCKESQETPIYY